MDLQHLARTRTSCFAAHPSRSNYLVIFVPFGIGHPAMLPLAAFSRTSTGHTC